MSAAPDEKQRARIYRLSFLEIMTANLTDGRIEIRCIHPEGKRPHVCFFEDVSEANLYVEEMMGEWNCYLAMCSRDQSGRGKKENLVQCPGLWIDCDIDELEKIDEKIEELRSFQPSPTVLVHSGNGVHAHWVFEEPFDVSTGERRADIESMLRGLQKRLDGDPARTDSSSVMRIPGTLNHPNAKKIEKGRVRQPTALLPGCGVEYSPEEFSDFEEMGRPAVLKRLASSAASDYQDIPSVVAEVPDEILSVLNAKGERGKPRYPKVIYRWGRATDGLKDQSESSVDMSLCTLVAEALVTGFGFDAEKDRKRLRELLAAAITCSRAKHGKEPKNPTAIGKTVDKAIASIPAHPSNVIPIKQGEWGEIIEASSEASVPEFPLDAMPQWSRPYIEAVSERFGNPVDMAAQCALSVMASAAMNSATVKLGDWKESLSLYIISGVAPPGAAKSPTLNHMSEPLDEHQKDQRADKKDQIIRDKARRELIQDKRNSLKKKVKDQDLTDEGMKELEEELFKIDQELDVPQMGMPHYVLDDFTIPALAKKISESEHQSMTIASAEGSDFFNILAGKYSTDGGSDTKLIANAWSGESTYQTRIGRGDINLERPLITVNLMIQPSALQSMTSKRDMQGLGVLDRFVWTHAKSGLMPARPKPIPEQAKRSYQQAVGMMFKNERPRDDAERYPLNFDPDAAEILKDFFQELNDMQAVGEVLEDFSGLAAKMRANVLRLCGILHLAESFGPDALSQEILPDTVEKAIRIGHYWIAHGLSALGILFERDEDAGVKRVLKWIERRHEAGELIEGNRFKKQTLHQAMKPRGGVTGSIPNADALSLILMELKDQGILRELGEGLWEINPKHLEGIG